MSITRMCKTCREAEGGPHVCDLDKCPNVIEDTSKCECKKCNENRVLRKYMNSFSMVEDEIIYKFLNEFSNEEDHKSIKAFLQFIGGHPNKEGNNG